MHTPLQYVWGVEAGMHYNILYTHVVHYVHVWCMYITCSTCMYMYMWMHLHALGHGMTNMHTVLVYSITATFT